MYVWSGFAEERSSKQYIDQKILNRKHWKFKLYPCLNVNALLYIHTNTPLSEHFLFVDNWTKLLSYDSFCNTIYNQMV